MFWDQGSYNLSEHCAASWGMTPRPSWAPVEYGGLEGWRAASNIVFSNGDMDPWSVYGLKEDVSGEPVVLA